MHNAAMRRVVKWGAWAALLLLLMVGAALLAVQRWVSTEAFRQRVQAEAEAALGVPLRLGSVGVTLLPLPGLALEAVEVRTRQPLTVERIDVRPSWLALLTGRVAVSTLRVQRAVLPQQGIDALLQSVQKLRQRSVRQASATPWHLLPRHTVLDEVRWIDSRGQGITIRAQAVLDSDVWPGQLDLQVIEGRLQGARLQLQRQDEHSWDVAMAVAEGTVQGRLEVQVPGEGTEFVLKAQLRTRDVELSRLTAPQPTEAARTAQPLSGRLEADTILQARARQPSALLDGLQTQSKFTVRRAVLHGVDLVKAVQTAGVSRGGQTPLDMLTGQLSTRGKAIELQNLVARSGALGATGQVNVSTTQQLSGRINADVAGAVGVPLVVGGTVDEPEVSLSTGAKIGAALGTVLMPGVGTGAGASLGGKLGELLGK